MFITTPRGYNWLYDLWKHAHGLLVPFPVVINLCGQGRNVLMKKYFVAKYRLNSPYRAYARIRVESQQDPDAWHSGVLFESDSYKECLTEAKKLNRKQGVFDELKLTL